MKLELRALEAELTQMLTRTAVLTIATGGVYEQPEHELGEEGIFQEVEALKTAMFGNGLQDRFQIISNLWMGVVDEMAEALRKEMRDSVVTDA